MNTQKDMRKDLLILISRLILEKDEDIPFRLNMQDTTLKDVECTNPELGKWIDGCDFPFLIETLVLDVATFSREFPDVQLTEKERKEFANALEAHCETCKHCSLKRSDDLEWQARVDDTFAENKEVIGKAIARAVGKK
jgi:hypothetical protein